MENSGKLRRGEEIKRGDEQQKRGEEVFLEEDRGRGKRRKENVCGRIEVKRKSQEGNAVWRAR